MARLLPVAETLETIGRRLETRNRPEAATPFNRAAEGVYRRYAAENPKEEVRLGTFLARQGRLDDALEVLENGWREAPSRALGAAAISMIAGTGATDAQLKRIEKVLDDALAGRENSVSLLLAKAELYIFQGRDRDAENIYREVIKQNADNVVALNNLAVFLANRKTELDEALRLINKCIELAGPVAPLLDSRGTVYMAQGNWEAAIEDLEEAISDTATPSRYFHLAEAHYGFQNISAAMKALQEAHNMGLSEKDLRKAELPRYTNLKKALSRAPESR
jgi:cellulose synthase operon protein C